VFWVDVGKASTAESDFIAIAKRLGQPVESLCDALQVLASTKQSWLLILDNADNPNFDYQAYFPSGRHGAVLMTSRVSYCKRYSPDANEALEGLEDKDSQELLLKAADIPKESWPSYYSQAEKVVQLLGSHTLALIQAGAYIAKGHCQLHEYPEVYQRQRERLLRYRPEQARSRYHDVYATFEASAEVLEQSESEAAKDALCLLAVLAMLDSAVLPLQIFQSAWDSGREVLCTSRDETSKIDVMSRSHALRLPRFLLEESGEWDPFRLTEASSKLISLSLVIRHDLEGSPGLSMHPLTHAWAKDRQDLERQKVAWVATGCVLALSRTNSTMWQTQERRLLPHIQSYLDIETKRVLSFGSEALTIPILLKCGWALLDMRQDSRLSHLLEDIFTKLGKNSEEPSKESLPLYDLQARSLRNMGEHKKAVALLEQVVKIEATTLAETHPDRLASQHVLAIAYEANGQVAEAVALLDQVVAIHRTTLAETHPDRLASQHALAIAYKANGQVAEAIRLLEQVVALKKLKFHEGHPSRVVSEDVLSYYLQRT
jgi:Tetratricopeptide repeat